MAKAKTKTKTKSKSSATDRHAKMLAVALASGQLPPLTAEIEIFLDECPKEIFTAFEGLVRHMPPVGDNESLAVGYLFLLQALLERLRFRSERGYPDAVELIAKFQSEVAGRALAGRIEGEILAHVSGVLEQAKIPASPELIAASVELGLDNDEDEEMLPADIDAMLDEMLDVYGDHPFMLVSSFAQATHAMPAEVKGGLAVGLAAAERPEARSAAVLFLLDASAEVRRATAAALTEVAGPLSPVDLRRLIAMRNWRPESERADLDAIVHKARAAGIACAPWETGSADTLRASPVDGSMAQAFLLTSPAGLTKKRMSSILTKNGITDAWSAEPEAKRQIELAIAASGVDVPMPAVCRGYLDRMVSHHLALTIAKGETPAAGLLQVAETIGGADWQPALLDFREELAGLITDLPELDPDDVDIALANSDTLFDLDRIEEFWFEDDADVARIVADGADGDDEALVTLLLQSVFDQRRDKWAGLFVQIASWMRQADAEYPSWTDLTVVARAMWEGRDLADIGLMRNIAERTVDMLADQSL